MRLSQPVPILRILDEAKAREFYVDFLGFSIDFEHRFEDNAPLYLQVSRDGCTMHLSEHYGDSTPGGALRIETDDVEGLNRELLEKRYKYAKPGVSDTPWRTREMSLKDPFGNRLVFAQRLDVPRVDLELPRDSTMTAVGSTARWVAANRAFETESPEPLYRDPYAREMAGASGFAMMKVMRAAMGAADTATADPYLTVRTKFLDDQMLSAVRDGSITQAVILASGLDARAFRLDWPAGFTLFEVDRDDIFDHKEAVLDRAQAQPRCDRRIVRADLSRPWTDALVGAGFDPGRPAAFLVEGLLMYLDEAGATQLVEAISTIARARSWLGLDVVNTSMLTSSYTSAYMKKLAEAGCPWKFGVDDPLPFLTGYGWHAVVTAPGEPAANYGRWPFPVIPRTVAGMPRAYFVHAQRQDLKGA